MKAKEFILEDDMDLHLLDNALESWMEMQAGFRDIAIIQYHPHSQQFKKIPQIKSLYRTLVPGDKKINQIKSTGDLIAYAYDIRGAHQFARSIDIDDQYVVVEKKFHPKDFILNFTALYEDRNSSVYGPYSGSEFEVWMKPTSYYTTYKKSEIVYTEDLSDDTED